MISQIADKAMFVLDGGAEDIDELGEDLLSDGLPHVVCELLINHEKHESTHAHHLNDWVCITVLKLMHNNVSHDFYRLPKLLFVVEQLFQLLEEVLHGDTVNSKRPELLIELLALGQRGTPLLA